MNTTTLGIGPDTIAADWAQHDATTRAARRPAHRHGNVTIALHWFSAGAMGLALGSVWAREWTDNDVLRTALMGVHRQAGLAVLMALALRLALRWRDGLADHAGRLPLALRLAAQAMHLALYALLFALPVLGLAASQAHAVAVKLFGLVPLPLLVRPDADLADRLGDLHAATAWVLLALVAVHIGAALWHHAVRRDGVLAAMLPLVRRRAAAGIRPAR
jgi:cytochrome b561